MLTTLARNQHEFPPIALAQLEELENDSEGYTTPLGEDTDLLTAIREAPRAYNEKSVPGAFQAPHRWLNSHRTS